VASVVWIGARFEFANPVSPSASTTNVPKLATPEQVAVTKPVDNAQPTSIEPIANRGAAEEPLVNGLGAQLYTLFNGPFVQFLVSRGLSSQDSERVIGEAFHEAAICWFAAIRVQTQAEGRSFDPAFELARGAMSNPRALNQLSASCINSALEHVGVNPPLGIKANDA